MDIISKPNQPKQEDKTPEPVSDKPSDPSVNKPDNPSKRTNRFAEYLKRHKKAIFITIPIVLVAAAALGAWFYYKQPSTPSSNTNNNVAVQATQPAKPTTVEDPLTGLQVSPSVANQPVVGVMIENLYPDARPQSGLGQAGLVYEALAEGGITRFLAIFQEPFPTSIGPVRSLRPYYLDWGLEHNIPVAHAGGSEPALAEIGPLGLKNIDALVYDGSYFFRTTDRAAPHNLYTNNTNLSALLAKLGYATAPTFKPLTYKADSPLSTPTHTKIDIDYGQTAYNVEWQYNSTNNNYERFQGGTAQVDRNTNTQITAKNIVVMYTPTTYSTQGDGKPETNINLIGSGQGLLFEDGDVTDITWTKTSDSAQTVLTDATGNPAKFNAGNTWFEVIPTGNTVTD